MAITNEKAANTCSFFEIDAGECMEYYGARRGRYICKDYYDDFQECRYQFKQVRHKFRIPLKKSLTSSLISEFKNHCNDGNETKTIQRILGWKT